MLFKIFAVLFLSTQLFADRNSTSSVDVIKYLFETKYAPLSFKEQTLGFNLNRSILNLKQSIGFSKNPQGLLRKFFLQLSDYHLSILFHSTSSASLPFTVTKIDNGLYVSWVDPAADVNLKIGDQILHWDGVDALYAFNTFKAYEMIDSTELYSTDAVTELYFTSRIGEFGMDVPHGELEILCVDKETQETKFLKIHWQYTQEAFPYRTITQEAKAFSLEVEPDKNPLLNKSLFLLNEVHETSSKGEPNSWMGSKRGYLPVLGNLVTEFKKSHFFYYIYKNEYGRSIAFLRIGQFQFERTDLLHLKKILNFLEKNTDGMVLDITHNPGGLVLDMFALISYFIEFPIENYQQIEILTSEEIELAVELKMTLENAADEKEALKIIKRQSQYNPSLRLRKQLLNYSNFLLSSWKNGEHVTALYPILGIDQIHPDTTCNYSKPLLILTDNLSFSCGDFMPGILQECGRAKIMGQRTGGAGGCVAQSAQFPNALGIKNIVFTSSLVYKNDGNYIENNGIEPDFPYKVTVNDIRNEYVDYASAINETIEELCAK